MDPTLAKSSAQLGIKLDHTAKWQYIPGDTIIGHVHRTAHGIAPEAKVSVTIHGHSKSRIKIRSGQSERRYESSFNCLSGPVDTQILHANAPLHIPEGSDGFSWPFAIEIPAAVRDARRESQKKHFSSPGGVDAAALFPPPGSFTHAGESYLQGEKAKAFIEYYVQAKIEISHQYRGRTVKNYQTATAPFKLKNATLGPPVTDFNMKPYGRRHSVLAYKLVPGVGELSFTQKTRQTFSSSKVPSLTFNLIIYLPSKLQIGNMNLIPLKLNIEPINTSTSELIHDIPQQVLIQSISLRLKPRTLVQAEKHRASKSATEVTLISPTAILALGREISITVTPGAGATAPPPLRLGEILDFRMRSRVHPSFKTYNVNRCYELIWQVEGVVAGERFKLGSTHSVEVLPEAFELGGGGGEVLPEYNASMDVEELPWFAYHEI
ncbi:hypothetical protein BDW59DRAFT_154950 [Aspergillus cavernicola]|uniref:Arrestin-like N-terminal domain-containing protein n=1 Tax=Aspergillus cavernicola TaxID=176166 RepID=A0ABR4HEK8_9EURO